LKCCLGVLCYGAILGDCLFVCCFLKRSLFFSCHV
jgi:hypothetical protein